MLYNLEMQFDKLNEVAEELHKISMLVEDDLEEMNESQRDSDKAEELEEKVETLNDVVGEIEDIIRTLKDINES